MSGYFENFRTRQAEKEQECGGEDQGDDGFAGK